MKKIILGLLVVIVGSIFVIQNKTDNDPDRLAYIEALTVYIEMDTDLRDYNIPTKEMSECVLELTERGMRGFSSSMTRKDELEMYTQWVQVKTGKALFNNPGDAQALGMKVVGQGAHTNFGSSYQYCIERVAPHNQEQIAADEDWVENKAEDITKWWDSL
jgi:hypothetical protein